MYRLFLIYLISLLATGSFAQSNLFRGGSLSGQTNRSYKKPIQSTTTSSSNRHLSANSEFYFMSSKNGSVAKFKVYPLGCSVSTPTGLIFTTSNQPKTEGNNTIWTKTSTIGFTTTTSQTVVANDLSSLRVTQTGFMSFDTFYNQPISKARYEEIAANVKKVIGNAASNENSYSNSSISSQSSTSSSRKSSSVTRQICPTCHGVGFQRTPYEHAASSAAGAMQPYHNHAGYSCPYCSYSTDHFHYPCHTCWGHRTIQK